MTAKQLLHDAVEDMSEEEALDWLVRVEESRPYEPLTPEQIVMIERGLADLDAGRKVTQEEALRRLGIQR